MTICAVIAGCDVWEDIEVFCRVKEKWIREALHMELPNGLPSHDTIQRVWGMLKPNEFKRCFRGWIKSVCGTKEGEIISIDGKTLRRSGDKEKNPLHMVSAWANQNQLVLGQWAWCLDMTFHEDYSRIRKNHSAENMAVVRHIALDILKQYPAKISLARKHRRCFYDDDFLAAVVIPVHA